MVGDWGTAGDNDKHFGGTPTYASPHAFVGKSGKDLFAYGRIAMELFLSESGIDFTFSSKSYRLWM